MKQWPETGPLTDDALQDVRDAVPWALKYLAGTKASFSYAGYDTPSFQMSCLPPDELLTVEHLTTGQESPIDALITIAFRLGYEQGSRTVQDEIEHLSELRDRLSSLLERAEKHMAESRKLAFPTMTYE